MLPVTSEEVAGNMLPVTSEEVAGNMLHIVRIFVSCSCGEA
jgi:hypothetical protein